MESIIGQTLGQYQVVEQIGKGGMATVYKAHQPSLNRYVAIKILPAYYAHEPGFAERFTREAQAIAQLDHPHILPVYDFGKQGDISYIVMKYVPSGTLRDQLGQPMSPAKAVEIIEQIASALDSAHQRGIYHRDVKPGNILIDHQNWIYLSDFGLAKMVESSVKLTGSGVGVGTPAYMSPEQGQGLSVDARTDIYALGVILFEMLTGQVPYEAETPMAIVIKHITAPIPVPHRLNPNIPEVVERVLLKSLAKNREERFASAGEMAAALRRAVQGLDLHIATTPIQIDLESTILHHPAESLPPRSVGVPPPSSIPSSLPPLPPPSPPRPQGLPWLLPVGLLGVVVVCGLVLLASWFYYSRGRVAMPTPTLAAVVATPLPTSTPSPSPTSLPASESTSTLSPTPGANSQQDQLLKMGSLTPTFTPPLPTATPTVIPTPTLEPTFAPPSPPPSKPGLQEDFTDQTQFFEQWESFSNGGAVQLVDGTLSLTSNRGNTFPFVRLRYNPFPAKGDFILTVELQYLKVGAFGTGLVVGMVPPVNGNPVRSEPDPNIEQFKIWQDTLYYNTLMVGAFEKTKISLPAPDTQRHQVQFVYTAGQVQVYLDSKLVGQEPERGARPATLWLGNPYRVPEAGDWSELQVYSVLVKEIKPTPTFTPPPQLCSTEPQGIFRNLWLKHKDRLGCPNRVEPLGGFYAEQPFENGHMFWSELGKLFLIVIGDQSGTWRILPEDESTWKDGMPPKSCEVAVPPGLIQPIRGFGGLWCAYPEMREKIGWALVDERGFEDGIDFIQGFDGGVIFRDSDGRSRGLAYVLFKDDMTFTREAY